MCQCFLTNSSQTKIKMKKKLGIMFFIFVVLLLQLFQLGSAQVPLQVDEEDKGSMNNNWVWTKAVQADKASEMAQEASHLMGEERCEDNDEECMKRRMMTESHLDYIYTQSHNKP